MAIAALAAGCRCQCLLALARFSGRVIAQSRVFFGSITISILFLHRYDLQGTAKVLGDFATSWVFHYLSGFQAWLVLFHLPEMLFSFSSG